jgi:hypothetical protein
MDRTDRVLEEEGETGAEYRSEERVIIDLEFPRQAIPEPSDGEVC